MRRRRRGFTLMEVLLVLAILVILGSLAAMSFTGVMSQSDIDAAKSQVGLLKTPVDLYYNTFRTYPPTLQALVVAPPDVDQAKWGRIIGPSFPSGLPKDPWNGEYKFAAPGSHNPNGYDIWSAGPDGVDGTEDDIGNWETAK
jgi:general secretion pathway protein G